MRTLSLPLRDNLQLKKKAVEPVVIVGIEWTPGNEILYADRKINDQEQPFPILNDMGNFDTSQIVSGSGSSQQVPFILSDIPDGQISQLRTIVDSADIHKAKVRIYLSVQGIDPSNKTLLFQGEINSPLEWDEGDRTLGFDVISQVESTEAGFAIEDGDFPQVPEELRGKPWPMVFGDVCWEKTQRIRAPRKGFLAHPQGVIDFTLQERLCQARQLTCAQKYEPPRTDQNDPLTQNEPPPGSLASYGCISFRDNKTGDKGCVCPDLPFGTCPTPDTETDKIDTECLNRRFNEICRLIDRLAQEQAKVVNPMTIRGGTNFPQSQLIRINIEGVIFEGIMTGTSFAYSTVIHPQQDEINNPPCKKITEAVFGWRKNAPEDGWDRTSGNGRSFEFNGTAISAADCAGGGTETTKVIDGPGESWRYYERFEAADFIGLNAGAEVYLEDESEILHIANLFGGTATGVAAYRKFGEQTLLVNLPTTYYTSRITDYGDYPNVLEIALSKPLNLYLNENWETDIYVQVSSPVGPNPADCIKFLVDTYLATSGITMDTDSYNDVKPKLANYPIGTMVTDRPSVFQLIGDIAYQSRCAAVVRDGKMVLIYLSEEPTPIRTLTMADILPESIQITHGRTEELNTKHDIEWSEFGASVNKDDDPERRILIKFNIPLYGTHKVDYDYYTQNTFDTVLKSATFWMIRESTTWQRINFETPLTQIDLDAFDAIALDIPQFTQNTTVIIEDASYNASTSTIKFRCWTPIRAGETIEYLWAWPAQQDAKEVFPMQGRDDGREGDALGFDVSPPIDHVLSGGFIDDDPVVQTVGDRNPSDLDDVFPTLECPDANDPDIAPALEPFEFDDFKEIANRQDDHFENNQDSFGGGGGSTSEDNEKMVCGQPHPSDTCTYVVNVTYITPTSVTSVQVEGTSCPGGGPCNCENQGRACTGPQTIMCHTFGARWAAQQFSDQKRAEAKELFDTCGYECGVGAVFGSGSVELNPGSGGFGACEAAPGDPNDPAVDDGEIGTAGEV